LPGGGGGRLRRKLAWAVSRTGVPT